MIIKPMIRSSICLNSHPEGCAKEVKRQIDYVKTKKSSLKLPSNPPKMALVLGCSTGYGLASRITASFEYGMETVGVSFEKEATVTKGGTPGWYNNKAFDEYAKKDGIYSLTFNVDAFSNEARQKVADAVKLHGKKIDLVVYSIASPVRVDPTIIDDNGEHHLWRSVIKPIGSSYTGDAINIMEGKLIHQESTPATSDEILATKKVMGGADWALWINYLLDAGVLADGCKSVAYSYIGPKLSHAIYRDGTIGEAKKDLESCADRMDMLLRQKVNGAAWVSVNKGLVTRSSAVIPIISLYLSVLFKVMKDAGTHEGCIEQMERLFSERLYTGGDVPTDEFRRIRIDDKELDPAIQAKVDEIMPRVTLDNMKELCDYEGYRHDFLATNGFDVPGVDYEKDVTDMTAIE